MRKARLALVLVVILLVLTRVSRREACLRSDPWMLGPQALRAFESANWRGGEVFAQRDSPCDWSFARAMRDYDEVATDIEEWPAMP